MKDKQVKFLQRWFEDDTLSQVAFQQLLEAEMGWEALVDRKRPLSSADISIYSDVLNVVSARKKSVGYTPNKVAAVPGELPQWLATMTPPERTLERGAKVRQAPDIPNYDFHRLLAERRDMPDWLTKTSKTSNISPAGSTRIASGLMLILSVMMLLFSLFILLVVFVTWFGGV